jgi:hypothetical protein
MDKIKLQSMVEYVKLMEHKRLKTFITETKVLGYDKNLKFANFLSQQPNIGMFVPAVEENGEWKKLEEPNHYKEWKSELDRGFEHAYENLIMKQYQTALDNVIFEGFEVCENAVEFPNSIEELFYFTENKWWLNEKFKTLEDLTKHNLTLTPKFAKELGLI